MFPNTNFGETVPTTYKTIFFNTNFDETVPTTYITIFFSVKQSEFISVFSFLWIFKVLRTGNWICCVAYLEPEL